MANELKIINMQGISSKARKEKKIPGTHKRTYLEEVIKEYGIIQMHERRRLLYASKAWNAL